MQLADVNHAAICAQLDHLSDHFSTRDVADHAVKIAHGPLAATSHYRAVIGKYLSLHSAQLGIAFVKKGSDGRGALWQKVAAPVPLPGIPQPGSRFGPVRRAHWASLAYMGSPEFASIKSLLEAEPELGGVYFRPTQSGVVAVDLHAQSLKPKIGIGANPSIPRGTTALRFTAMLPDAIAHVLAVRARQSSPSRENQLEARLIREAQANGLRLPGFPAHLRFIHSQWRVELPPGAVGQRFTDLLAVDTLTRQLVIIELKAAPSNTAAAQVAGYVSYFEHHAEQLLPFFSALAVVMGRLYGCEDDLAGPIQAGIQAMTAWPLDDALVVQRLPLAAPPPPRLTTIAPISPDSLGPQFALDPPFRARMRLHQSWWRVHHLQAPCGSGPGPGSLTRYGNMLLAPQGASGKNFLTPAIYAVARARVAERHGAVAPFRLLHNMLSSQPMCFNLFGMAAANLDLATRLFGALLPGEVAEVTDVRLEYAPRPAHQYLGDQTAFDAFVAYRRPDGSMAFLGIETKLTEPFSPRVYDRPSYRALTERADSIWRAEAWPQLADIRWNQLWRDHMLVDALRRHASAPHGTSGRLVLIHHPLDDEASRIAARYREFLEHPDETFLAVPLDHLVRQWQQVVQPGSDEADWLASFDQRYVDLRGSDQAWQNRHTVSVLAAPTFTSPAESALDPLPAEPDLFAIPE
jgi:hypothetical protein